MDFGLRLLHDAIFTRCLPKHHHRKKSQSQHRIHRRRKCQAICDQFDVDIEDILLDLEEFLEDSRRAKWLANGSEDWTEGFTEEEELYSTLSANESSNDDTDDSILRIEDED